MKTPHSVQRSSSLGMASQPQGKQTVSDVRTWEQTFQELMQQEKPRARWTLKLDGKLEPDCLAEGWKQYQQKGFGRFQCSSCQRSWASAQVLILCHMYLEHQKSQGQVIMRLFAQRCKKCSWSRFEDPEFSPESTMRILKNVVRRILEKFYGNGFRKFPELPIIREVPLDGSHDTINCEACTLGYCLLRSRNNTTEPSISPFSCTDNRSSSSHIGDVSSQNQECGNYYGSKGSGPSHTTTETQAPGAGTQPKGETSRPPTPMADRQTTQGDSQTTQGNSQFTQGTAQWQTTPMADRQTTQGNSQATQVPWRTYSEVLKMARQQSAQQSCSQATWRTDPKITSGAILRFTSRSHTQTIGRTAPSTLGPNLKLTQRRAGFVTIRGAQAVWESSSGFSVPNTCPIHSRSVRQEVFYDPDVFFYFCVICIIFFFTFASKYLEAERSK
uniref:3CxxC-type domain-containing protein n=2 Tax=Canis lupus familiaris TaxID=9615 RepID=A0A8C0T0U4_CANLF